MDSIVELNELISAGEKLVSNKIGRPLKNPNGNIKPEWEMWYERKNK